MRSDVSAAFEPADQPPILVVDDQAPNLDAIDAVLTQTGCRLVRAASADQALLALLEQDFAAIVLDIRMPGMNGIELADLIKARPRSRHVPILFLTAHLFDEHDVLRGYGVGAVDYLTKPVHADILRSKIAVFVELFRKRRALAVANEALRREIMERQRAEEALRIVNSQLEERVRERTEALERADRRKDEFLAVLGHELRNPLAPILSALEVIAPANTEAEGAQARNVVRRQVTHMARLIDDLLDVGRITSDRFVLQPSRVDLETIVSAAVETSRPLITKRGHDLAIALPNYPIWLMADGARLAQVLSNLLTNAAKYTPVGGRIHLSATAGASGLTVRVRDSGIGIDPGMLNGIFELFVRIEIEDERASGGGLGIGLALARQLVHLHGGRIDAASQGAGRGSEFTVWLPPAVFAAGAASAVRAPIEAPAHPLRVLVVDDNLDAADMMAFMLTSWGHDAKSVYEGESALDIASVFQPQVVLLDLALPGLDGYGVAERLRGQPWASNLTLFAVTGRGQDEDRQRSYANGFQEHIVKPVVPDTLRRLLAQIQPAP